MRLRAARDDTGDDVGNGAGDDAGLDHVAAIRHNAPMSTLVKICGLKHREHIEAAVSAGAEMIGFNFFARSPRVISLPQVMKIHDAAPAGVAKVAVVVDADDALFDAIVGTGAIDILQLHGSETPERCLDLKARYGLPIIKVLAIETKTDVARIAEYAEPADQFLFEAKPPKGATRPGGNAISFDWSLLTDAEIDKPWLLAGGLTPDNVADGIRQSGAPSVDVSSGVETAPGEKDSDLIRAFIENAKEV